MQTLFLKLSCSLLCPSRIPLWGEFNRYRLISWTLQCWIYWITDSKLDCFHLFFTDEAYPYIFISVSFLQYVNPTFEKLSGYKVEEVIGKKFHDLSKTDGTKSDIIEAISNQLENGKVIRVLLGSHLSCNDLTIWTKFHKTRDLE